MSLSQKQTVQIRIKVWISLLCKIYLINNYILAKRKDKQSLRLLRGSERDLKLDITSAQLSSMHDSLNDSHVPIKTPQPSVQIESCKQFKSLCSIPVSCPKKSSQPLKNGDTKEENSEEEECSQNRVEFHKMLSLLIRMGCGDKQAQERVNPRRNVSAVAISKIYIHSRPAWLSK